MQSKRSYQSLNSHIAAQLLYHDENQLLSTALRATLMEAASSQNMRSPNSGNKPGPSQNAEPMHWANTGTENEEHVPLLALRDKEGETNTTLSSLIDKEDRGQDAHQGGKENEEFNLPFSRDRSLEEQPANPGNKDEEILDPWEIHAILTSTCWISFWHFSILRPRPGPDFKFSFVLARVNWLLDEIDVIWKLAVLASNVSKYWHYLWYRQRISLITFIKKPRSFQTCHDWLCVSEGLKDKNVVIKVLVAMASQKAFFMGKTTIDVSWNVQVSSVINPQSTQHCAL